MKDHPGGSTNLQAFPEEKGPPLEYQRNSHNSNQRQIAKKAQRKKRRGWDKEKIQEGLKEDNG